MFVHRHTATDVGISGRRGPIRHLGDVLGVIHQDGTFRRDASVSADSAAMNSGWSRWSIHVRPVGGGRTSRIRIGTCIATNAIMIGSAEGVPFPKAVHSVVRPGGTFQRRNALCVSNADMCGGTSLGIRRSALCASPGCGTVLPWPCAVRGAGMHGG